MEKIIAIVDSDSVYAARFMEYIKNRKEYDFEILAFTRYDSIVDYVRQNKIEILLIEEEFASEEFSKENIKYIYVLSEKPGSKNTAVYPGVFKYQKVREIMNEVLTDYIKNENAKESSRIRGGLRVISIFSPIPKDSKALFAWSVAINLSESKKILFIPLKLFPVPCLSNLEGNSQGLSEFIYFLKENNPDIITKLKTLLRYSGNLSCLSGLNHGFDALSINKEDIVRLLQELEVNTDYEAAVFYVEIYSDAMMELIKKSDTVLLPVEENEYERMVFNEWKRQIEFAEINYQPEKFIQLELQLLPDQNYFVESIEELKKSPIWFLAEQYCRNQY